MVLLGSTGSIGVNTLVVAERFNIEVEALVAGNNISLLKEQIARFKPRYVCVSTKELADKIDHPRVFWGEEGMLDIIGLSDSELVVNALVGFLGLKPTVAAIEEGKVVALANKESLVAAGAFIDSSRIRPIDSEHFALWYLLNGRRVKKMVITASGGAFRNWPVEKIVNASLEDALRHPNWCMGPKITIDSATMINKLFELLEARWLFGCKNIDAVIETKSIVHALVEFVDGVTTAQMSVPDMKLPITYALMQEIDEEILESLDLLKLGRLEFGKIAPERYPVWKIKDDLLENPKLGVVVNSANESAIKKFMDGAIPFGGISKLVLEAYNHFHDVEPDGLDDVFSIDKEVRRWCEKR